MYWFMVRFLLFHFFRGCLRTCSEISRLRDASKTKFGKRRKSKKQLREEADENCVQLLLNLAQEESIRPIYTAAYNMNERNPGKFSSLCIRIKTMAISMGVAEEGRNHINRMRRSNGRFSNLVDRLHAKLGQVETRDVKAFQALREFSSFSISSNQPLVNSLR